MCKIHFLLSSDSIAVPNAGFGEGSGSIILDDVMCVGNETNILDCARGAEIYASNCEHREDVAVRCQGT